MSAGDKTGVQLGRHGIGVSLQGTTLLVIVGFGWEARGYLEEQTRAMDELQRSVTEIRDAGRATTAQLAKVEAAQAKNIERLHAHDEGLQAAIDRIRLVEECIRDRRRCRLE